MRLGHAGLALLALLGCRKAPLFDVDAQFTLADATWFAEEDTLFVFYEITAEQGLNDESVVEITYETDDEFLDWTSLTDLPSVHPHVPVDCGPDTRCGSASLAVALKPRDVKLRFRYHRDGELSLNPETAFNVVGLGPPYSNRSLIVYGVLDETNEFIQWRGRHQFPAIRNHDAEALGLRRDLLVQDAVFGSARLAAPDNPYGYGATCPDSFLVTGFGDLRTQDRAAFYPDRLPIEASTASTVCAAATVTDANGTFTTGAIARKNAEVRPAFPVLKNPVRDATPLPFFLGPCDRTISAEHEEMLRQRLQIGSIPTTCTDEWDSPDFVPSLVVALRAAVEATRPAGNDLVLTIALNQDEVGVSETVEAALALVLPEERHRTTPRLAGAFVLDSDIRGMTRPELSVSTLWCPSTLEGDITDESTRSCAVAPDNVGLDLGVFTFGTLPILPPRDQYLDFIDEYSVQQAGEVTALAYRVPEFATTTDHTDLGDFGIVTFLNQEIISADSTDAFSYCTGESFDFTFFQSEVLQGGTGACLQLGFNPEDCAAQVLPLGALPDWHQAVNEATYDLGIAWEFPFLLNMDYQAFVAGALTAFGFSVPFGLGSSEQAYYGSEIWASEEIDLSQLLTQCDRFCTHPAFDSAGVYHISDSFESTYAHSCYLPKYPKPGDSGFPLDP